MWGKTSSAVSERFAARRRVRRRRITIAFIILLALAIGGVVYGLHDKSVRISHITIYGADQSLSELVYAEMRGSYFGIIPRDSTFFLPDSAIRRAILSAHQDIAAVSIFRDGLTGLSIKPSERVAIARWCGLSPTPPDSGAHGSDEYCYVFDANGYVFGAADVSAAPINPFALYVPLRGDAPEPLGATLQSADALPGVFDLARELGTLGGSVTHIVIRGDEVDDFLKSGTRVTYLLGEEQAVYTALVAAKDGVNLTDGSIDYIDMRFGGKMYLKRK